MRGKRASTGLTREKPTYTEQAKIAAVTAMLLHEHPLSIEAQADACRVLGVKVDTGTLDRWLKRYGDKIKETSADIHRPADLSAIVATTQAKIFTDSVSLLGKLLQAADNPGKIADANLNHILVGYGIVFDKVAKMSSIRPEWIEKIGRLEAMCAAHGDDPLTLFEDFYNSMKELYAKQRAEGTAIVSHDE